MLINILQGHYLQPSYRKFGGRGHLFGSMFPYHFHLLQYYTNSLTSWSTSLLRLKMKHLLAFDMKAECSNYTFSFAVMKGKTPPPHLFFLKWKMRYWIILEITPNFNELFPYVKFECHVNLGSIINIMRQTIEHV